MSLFPQLSLFCCCPCCCVLWTYRRCCHTSEATSEQWPLATCAEFSDVPRLCHLLNAVYKMRRAAPYFKGLIDETCVARRAGYEDTKGRCPPYIIYVDHEARDICVAVRGLSSYQVSDYEILLDNKKGAERFDGGFVHSGLIKAAAWLLDQEMDTLASLTQAHPEYTVTLTGHSLGSGVVAMATVIMHKSQQQLPFSASRLRCFCVAPARSMSLNLAIKYADIINSVVLQDDFLARTSAPVRSALAAGFCFPCMLLYQYQQDALIPMADKLKDPRRLYAPGRLFHVLYRRHMSFIPFPHPIVKTAVPVDNRFERVVWSLSIVYDHLIGHIETRCAKALKAMEEEQQARKAPPEQQRMERSATIKERRGEHLEALQRAVSLHVAHAADPEELQQALDGDADAAAADDTAGDASGGAAGEEKKEGKGDEEAIVAKAGGVVAEKGGEGGGVGKQGSGKGASLEKGMEKVRTEVEKAVGVVGGRWSEIVNDLMASAADEVNRMAPGLAEENAHEWK